MKKKYVYLLSLSLIILGSCSKDATEDTAIIPEDVAIYVDGDNATILKSFELDRDYLTFPDITYMEEGETDGITTRAQGGPYTVLGYTGRTYLKTDKIGFGGSNPLNLQGFYLYDAYEYYYQVTIPHGATLNVPTTPVNPENMGCVSMDSFTPGYKVVEHSKNVNGDNYRITTYVRIITHNISGQRVGPYYYPYQTIKNPENFIFRYGWATWDW